MPGLFEGKGLERKRANTEYYMIAKEVGVLDTVRCHLRGA